MTIVLPEEIKGKAAEIARGAYHPETQPRFYANLLAQILSLAEDAYQEGIESERSVY